MKITVKFPPCATPAHMHQSAHRDGASSSPTGSASQKSAIAEDTAGTRRATTERIGTVTPPTIPNSWNSAAAPPAPVAPRPSVSCRIDGSQALTA